MSRLDQVSGPDPADPRHAHVHQDEIRSQLLDELERLLGAGRLADHDQARRRTNELTDDPEERRPVVHREHPCACRFADSVFLVRRRFHGSA